MLEELVRKNRSIRRFHQNEAIPTSTLKDLVNLARLSASGGNLQPLKYIISNTAETNAEIFACLVWAGYLKDWRGPSEGERPSAYIIMLVDTTIHKDPSVDQGIAAQSIMLGAAEKGIGGSIIGSIDREKIRTTFDIPKEYDVSIILGLGKPKEKVVIDEMKADKDHRYWRDENNVHHVPKRKLEDIIISIK